MSTLLDIPAVADRLGTSERHIRELIYRRDIPYTKVGRLVRFYPEDVEAWLQAHRVPVESGAAHA